MKYGMMLILFWITGCVANPDLEQGDTSVNLGVVESGLSDIPGCYFYVGSGFGGAMLSMSRNSTERDLHAYGMGDKISSVYLAGGATTKMWIDKYYRGNWWYITTDVWSLHDGNWGNLGDNASSADCY